MQTKNELAKEERTIFIVLAIIVLVAIGVLVTWYFTKDKNDDVKENTKTETVDKQKKKKDEEEDTTTTSKVIITTKDTTVSEVAEEVTVVAETGKTVPAETVTVKDVYVTYDADSWFYFANEVVDFTNTSFYDEDGNVLKIGSIVKVELWDGEAEKAESADGKYTQEGNRIIFTEEGNYLITVIGSDNQEHAVYVGVISKDRVEELLTGIETDIEETIAKHVDASEIKTLQDLIEKCRSIEVKDLRDQTELRETLESTLQKYLELSYAAQNEEYKINALAELQTRIDELAAIEEEDYTEESYSVLADLIATAKEYIADPSNIDANDIYNLITDLDNAEENLELIEVNKLVNVVDEVNTRLEENELVASAKLTDLLTNAQAIIDENPTVTTDEVIATLIDDINAEVEELDVKIPKIDDFNELVTTTEERIDNAELVPSTELNELLAVELTVENTVEEIDETTTELETEIAACENSVG